MRSHGEASIWKKTSEDASPWLLTNSKCPHKTLLKGGVTKLPNQQMKGNRRKWNESEPKEMQWNQRAWKKMKGKWKEMKRNQSKMKKSQWHLLGHPLWIGLTCVTKRDQTWPQKNTIHFTVTKRDQTWPKHVRDQKLSYQTWPFVTKNLILVTGVSYQAEMTKRD